jgi:HEPN domain-containing protein
MVADEPLSQEQVVSQTAYWLSLADYDLETARVMLAGGRLLYVGFMCHQVVEKALKAIYTAERQTTPPRLHALVTLAERAGLYEAMGDARQQVLEMLDPLNIQCRYPEQRDELLAALTPSRCQAMLDDAEELLEWIRQRPSSK